MTVEEYRQRMINAFHNADCDNLIALVALPTKKEFEHLEWLLKNHYFNQKQQPCDDCISRQAVLDGLASITKVKARSDAQKSLMGRIMFFVEQLPPVTPKEKTGKWIRWYETIEQEHCTIHDPHCKCSECNQEYDPYIASLFNYCPNCGRKMVEPQESEVNNGLN